MAGSWTGAQIATLAVDALTPLTVAGLGLFFARAGRRVEQVQWANQTVVTRRLDIFAQLAPGLNQLLFSDELLAVYRAFMATLFAMYATTDGDALLRAPVESRWGNRRNMPWWDEPSMAVLFSASISSTDDVQAAHDVLAERFRADLYVTRQTRPLLVTHP